MQPQFRIRNISPTLPLFVSLPWFVLAAISHMGLLNCHNAFRWQYDSTSYLDLVAVSPDRQKDCTWSVSLSCPSETKLKVQKNNVLLCLMNGQHNSTRCNHELHTWSGAGSADESSDVHVWMISFTVNESTVVKLLLERSWVEQRTVSFQKHGNIKSHKANRKL